jgi:hypothetical protein
MLKKLPIITTRSSYCFILSFLNKETVSYIPLYHGYSLITYQTYRKNNKQAVYGSVYLRSEI